MPPPSSHASGPPPPDRSGALRDDGAGAIADEHARHDFEQQLRASRICLALAERTGRLASWSRDLTDGRLVWSDALADLVGSAAAVEGATRADFLEHVHPDDAERVRSIYQGAVASGQEYEIEYRIRRPDGEVLWVSERAQAFVDQGRGMNHVCGVTMDITARKQADARDRELRGALAAFRASQAQQVEVELERVRSRLVRQTRLAAIGQLSAGIAHDLRNPLGVIRNAVYLQRRRLAKAGLDPEMLSIIDDEVAACNAIITNMLEMTRGASPNLEHVDLAAMLGDLARRIDATGRVRWRFELGDGEYKLRCDPAQFRQVFSNLFRNAVDAMNGRGEIVVVAHNAGDWDHIEVRDTGPGIAADIRPQLFEPLVTGKKNGTGLGLMICRQIVERHGGRITAEERPGAGAVFRISLPSPTVVSAGALA